MWFLALAVVVFAMYSLVVAASTADKCEVYGGEKSWQVLPPEWKCDVPRR